MPSPVERARVAALLGAPLVGDAGMPAVLALKDGGAGEQLAVKTPVVSPLPAPASSDKELPAVNADAAPAAVSPPWEALWLRPSLRRQPLHRFSRRG
jgi:hypothetical protein